MKASAVLLAAMAACGLRLPNALASTDAAVEQDDHSIDITVSNGDRKLFYSVNLPLEMNVNSAGGGQTPEGKAPTFIFNAILGASKHPDAYPLDYQIEADFFPGAEASGLQAQGFVTLRRGVAVDAVECGKWKISLLLDPYAKSAASGPDPNYALAIDLTKPDLSVRCRHLVERTSVLTNVVFYERPMFILSSDFSRKKDGKLDWKFELKYSRKKDLKEFELKDEALLLSGEKKTFRHGDYTIDLRVDSPRAD